MNIHEYQAKELLNFYGVTVDRGFVAESIQEVQKGLDSLPCNTYIIKAQIHSGGRGKAGGVKFARDKSEAIEHAKNILGMILVTAQTGPDGKKVRKVLITEAVDIKKEYYISLLIDRTTFKYVFVASTEGGVEIEKVAEEMPERIVKLNIDPILGFKDFYGIEMGRRLGFNHDLTKQLISFMGGMYRLFTEKDTSLIEINPLIETNEGKLIAIDAKINFDSNALYRHNEVIDMRDFNEEDPNEIQALKYNISYIKLDGNIGCLVNGAGLAMATMDIIKFFGGTPANFLDVGGTASVEKVTEAFKIILGDKNVNGILVNIFGGIMKCDVIAEGIVAASKALEIKIPIVVRLDGTNIEQGKKVLAESGLRIILASSLKDGAEKVVREANTYGNTR